ncbi:LysR substrate-binding domain-containing protein [Aliamphritea ceti]|uniref:LysR substrate-binding domain-containing protein n=1 Tax=Aliamphritea ceti TaxID=1524258 RepID=UPI0021C3272E|nr:LysR substrate-binding domain-containing protein [Aliamphritea ceti]
MRRKLPSTMSLQCFELAARLENFTQAANTLNMTQSALSRQIKLLEELVGQPLFLRSRQRVKLSPAGQSYLAAITPMIDDLEAATLKMLSFQDISGGINVGTYPTFGARWLLPYLLDFQNVQSDINLNTITYLDNSQFDPAVIDVGIVQGDPPWPGMRVDYLMPEYLAPVASPKLLPEPVNDPAQLMSQRILHHTTRPESWKIWFNDLGAILPEEGSSLRYSQYELIIEAMVAGHGIGLMPQVLIQRELKEGKLVPAHSHIACPRSAYYLLTPLHKVGISKIESFRSWFLQRVKELH